MSSNSGVVILKPVVELTWNDPYTCVQLLMPGFHHSVAVLPFRCAVVTFRYTVAVLQFRKLIATVAVARENGIAGNVVRIT